MSDVLITPLMGLSNPVPGADPGPDYANNIYNSLNILDQHNHTAGSGNQINTAAILINADLSFNSSYNLTQVRSVRFAAQGSPLSGATDLGCLYESGVDLYYNDGNGNQCRITAGGTVNATSSGISSGTASASFSGGVLVVDSATNTPGNIQAGSILIGNNTAGSNFATVSAPNALASNYQIFLPTIPAAKSFMAIDASGNITGYEAVANGITRNNLAAVGQQISSSSGTFQTTSASPVNVTNLSVTLTTTGRPVMIMLIPDQTGKSSLFASNPSSAAEGEIFINRDSGTVVFTYDLAVSVPGGSSSSITIPPGAINALDVPTAGSHTYIVQAQANSATVGVLRCLLIAYEL